jgi:hypothetical protein
MAASSFMSDALDRLQEALSACGLCGSAGNRWAGMDVPRLVRVEGAGPAGFCQMDAKLFG